MKGNGWESNHAFSDSHDVGRFIKEEIGEVKTVRATKGGIVIVERRTTRQRDEGLKITAFGRAGVVFPNEGETNSERSH